MAACWGAAVDAHKAGRLSMDMPAWSKWFSKFVASKNGNVEDEMQRVLNKLKTLTREP